MLLDNITCKQDLLYMHTRDFENVIAQMFRRHGNKVMFSDKFGDGDMGIILDDIKYVQVKKYPFHHLMEVEHAKKITKCMQTDDIYKGMIISLGDFKQNTRKFCHTHVIECIDGNKLLAMCKQVQVTDFSLARLIQH